MSLKSWWFPSETNPSKPPYETMLNDDESLSCNCMGWTRRCVGGRRSCRHTRMVEAGVADEYAMKVVDYRTGSTQRPVPFRQPKQGGGKTTNLNKGRRVAW